MASNNFSFNAPEIPTDKTYQIWSVRIKPYFETYVICEVYNNILWILQKFRLKDFQKELLDTSCWRYFFLAQTQKKEKKKEENFEVRKE